MVYCCQFSLFATKHPVIRVTEQHDGKSMGVGPVGAGVGVVLPTRERTWCVSQKRRARCSKTSEKVGRLVCPECVRVRSGCGLWRDGLGLSRTGDQIMFSG